LPGNRKQNYLQHNKYNMGFIEYIFNAIAPHACVGCAREGSLLCSGCTLKASAVPPRCYRCKRWNEDFATCQRCRRLTPLRHVWAALPYEKLAKEVLHKVKFERARAGTRTVAEVLAGICPPDRDFVITYIPTANSRVRERGYDQSALIARALARRVKQPCLPLIARVGDHRQVGQQREIRKEQMKDAFRPLKTINLQNKHVLLVDDVLTTGATCEAAARVLKQAGARHVSAIVFAVA
jgi:ComF family protein